MKESNKLIFIGPLRLGEVPRGGDTMKNHLFLKRFNEVFEKVYVIDTINWKKKPWVLVKMLCCLTFIRKAKVVVSCEISSAKVLDFLYYIRLQKDVFYWVVGSGFPRRIKEGTLNAQHYKYLKRIIVQSPEMVKDLENTGLKNAIYVPNSKPIYDIDIPPASNGKIKFVFLSRILQTKGVDLIINCSQKLNEIGYKDKYSIIFYGSYDGYPEFIKNIDQNDSIEYKGILDLTKKAGYDTLSMYDVMLFPTFYDGEGFPGIMIDAFISGLPVLATDWHCNKDIVENGKTGFIIPPQDEKSLLNKMKEIIDDREVVEFLRYNCQQEAKKYDNKVILGDDNLIKIGLLEF